MKNIIEKIESFFIPENLEKEFYSKAKLLCFTSPTIGLLCMAVFLSPAQTDELLKLFVFIGSFVLLSLPLVLKFTANYKITSGIFTSIFLALFPLCLFEYGGLLSPVLIWLPLMPLLLGYLLGWKEGASISALLALELIALIYIDENSNTNMNINTLSTILAIGTGVLFSFKLDSRSRSNETELTNTQAGLQEALRAKELFWNNISHEIRTPLNGIMGMTQVLLEAKTSSEQEELLKIIKESGVHLKAVLNDVVDYSQLELGDLKIRKELFNIQESVEKIISIFNDYLEDKDIELTYELNDHLPAALLSDPYRIKQILMHLTSNAIKFTNSGFVKIRVEITDRENVFLFSVTDSGKGIAKDDHSKIFTTFYQADTSATREHGGTGLGLALCQRLVKLLGGQLEFESKESQGSHFFFTVKAMPLDTIHNIQDKSEALNPSLTEFRLKKLTEKGTFDKKEEQLKQKITALVVEDNLVNLKLMETLLIQLGHDVVLSKNGAEALDKLEQQKIDIIFMDIQMPIMDGISCTKEIYRIYGEDRPAIVAVTANVHQRDECHAVGMDDFIGKPINITTIKNTLSRLMSTHRSYSEEDLKSPIKIHEESINTLTQNQHFDADAFSKNFGNDQDIILFLINQFKTSSPKLLKDIESALEYKDANRLNESAHSLKGALANFFCEDLRIMAQDIEDLAKKKNFKSAEKTYFKLKLSVLTLQEELEKSISNKKAAS